MRLKDLVALLFCILGSSLILVFLNSPSITGRFAEGSPSWVGEATTFYLAEKTLLKVDLADSFGGFEPVYYEVKAPPELFVYTEEGRMLVSSAPGVSGTFELVVIASDGTNSVYQTLTFVVGPQEITLERKEPSAVPIADEPEPQSSQETSSELPALQSSEPPVQEEKEEQRIYDDKGKIVGKKLEDEPDFETFFTFTGIKGNEFVITFYHNSAEEQEVWVEGAPVEIPSQFAEPNEEITISVPLQDGEIPHFILHVGSESEKFEFGITVITVQSYPQLGGNWTVAFNTTGRADLIIRGYNGTTFGTDISFLEVRCGDKKKNYDVGTNEITVKNYKCDEIGYETSSVLKAGKHTLEFQFGNDTDYAYNQVSLSACSTIGASGDYVLTQNVTAGGTCMNITVNNTRLDCQGFNITYATGGANLRYGINVSNGTTLGLNNVTIKNCGVFKDSTSGNEGVAIFFGSVTNHSVILNNTLRTNGSSSNFGVRLLTNNNNVTIENNTITTGGSGGFNDGLEIGSSSANITMVGNNISTSGTNQNLGIFLTAANDNRIENNIIRTSGTTSNRGIQIQDGYGNNITNNSITTSGTSANSGIFATPTGAQVNRLRIINNTIAANGTGGSNIGIEFATGTGSTAENSTVTGNRITTDGTSNNTGISLAALSDDHLFTSNNVTTFGTGSHGIVLFSDADDNNFTSNRITTVEESSNGIEVNASTGNIFRANLVNASHQSSFDWSSVSSAADNIVINLTLIRSNVNISFEEFSTNIKAVLTTELDANIDNPAQIKLNKFVNATNNTATSWLFLNFTYLDSEIVGIPERTIRIWRFDDTESMWFDEGFFDTSGVDITGNIVFANITDFSTFGAFGSVLFVNKTDNFDPVNISGILNYTIFINSTSGNASNITVNDTYPAQVIFVSSEPTPDSGTNNFFSIGNLSENQTFQINISVLINDTTSNNTVINNSVNVSFNNDTGSLLNTTAIESTTVLAPEINITTCPITINNTAIVGQNISANLTEHQSCITFGNSNIELDCQNFVLTGNGSGFGINSTGRTGVTVENCIISNFTQGIHFNNTGLGTIRSSTVNLTAIGIGIYGGYNATLRDTRTSSDNGTAFYVNGTENMTYRRHISTSINGTGTLLNRTTGVVVSENSSDTSTNGTATYYFNSSMTATRYNHTTDNGTAVRMEGNETTGSESSSIFLSNNTWAEIVGNISLFNWDDVTFNSSSGSITIKRAPGAVTVANNTVINQSNLNISQNLAFLNSTNLSFLNTSGSQIALTNITFSNPKPIVDFEDDGTFIDCSASICTEHSFANNVFVYNVTQFTTYSSNETTINACGVITNSSTLGSNISSAGTCITFGASNIFLDCAGYTIFFDTGGTGGDGVVASNKQNIIVRNCVLIDNNSGGATGIGIDFTSVNHSSMINNTIQTNGTTDNYGARLLTSSKNNTLANNTIRTFGTGVNNYGINVINTAAGNNNTDNNLTNNTIYPDGTSSNNYGINLQNNVFYTTIANNTIITNGTTLDNAVNIGNTLGGNSINYTNITGNYLQTNGTGNSNEGIRLNVRIYHTRIEYNTFDTQVRSPVAGNSHFGVNAMNDAVNITIQHNIIGTRTTSSDGIKTSAGAGLVANITIVNNSINTGGTGANGVDLESNTHYVLIENNTIMTGNASRAGASHGGNGINAIVASNSNITIFNNTITTNGTGASNIGITLGNFENATVANNSINVFGTNDNYGISLASGGLENAFIENNTIVTNGTSIQNEGIRTAGGNFNDNILIRNNNISTNGTSSDTGIFLSTIRNFHADSNVIRTNGRTGGNNRGIGFDSNVRNGTIANNTIDTNGTGSNHGIATAPSVGSLTFGIFVENNTINATATGTGTIGLQLVNTNSVNNTARNNTISVNGTTSVVGIQLTGSTLNNSNFVENNSIFINVTGATTRGIYVATTSLTANHNITNNTVTFNSTSTDVRGFAIETVTSINNYTGNTIRVERGTGALFYLVGSSNQQFNNTIVNMSSGINMIWIDAVLNNRNNLTNTTFANTNGSVRFPDRIEYNASATDFTQTFMNISFNRTFLNSSTFSQFNTTAQNTLVDLPFTNVDPVVDFENDGTFAACSPSICTEVSFSGGTFIFNVTQWTSYAGAAGSSACGTITSDTTLASNISSTGTCITFGADHITLDCAGNYLYYANGSQGDGVLAENRTNVTVKNCIIIDLNYTHAFGIGINFTNTTRSLMLNNTIHTNGTNDNYAIGIRSNAGENVVLTNRILTDGSSFQNIGINVSSNASAVNITNNTIETNGTSNNYGILAEIGSNNTRIENNTVFAKGTAGNNLGLFVRFNISNNLASNNSIKTNGTVNNRGVEIRDNAVNNTIHNNSISTNGTGTNNVGIQLAGPTVTGNNLTNNSIYANGTTFNFGIGFSSASSNLIENNTIITNGTSSDNYGIFLTTSSSSNNITNNSISTNGTSTNQGMRLTTTANNNLINRNTISTRGTGADNFGIYLLSTANQNNISGNFISTNGTSGNRGIRLDNVANDNFVENNSILTAGSSTNNFGFQIVGAATGNNVTNNSINTSGTLFNFGISLNTLTATYGNYFDRNNITTNGGVSWGVRIVSANNSQFNNTYFNNPIDWIESNSGSHTNFTNTTFATGNGSIRFNGTFQVNDTQTITHAKLNVTFNNASLYVQNLSYLNLTAQITLRNITFVDPKPIVDFDDDGTYADCPSTICTEVSYAFAVAFVYNVTHWTNYSSGENALSLEMPKGTINCTVQIFQDEDSATLYTCGDTASVNAAIVCDEDANGDSSATNATNSTSCDLNAANFGAFLLVNNGQNATLNATLVNVTVGGAEDPSIFLDNYIFNTLTKPGCNATGCNNCPAADTSGCDKDFNSSSSTPDTVTECDHFNGAGAGLCQCFSVHITNSDTIHKLKSGSALTFTVRKTVIDPASVPCP